VDGQTYQLPITQAELAHATGLSTVHVNRTLQELSTPKNGRVVIKDWNRLQEAGEFDASYLTSSKLPKRDPVAANEGSQSFDQQRIVSRGVV